MFINEIQLKGFRSHQDTKIVGLRRFNIFLGPNGSGKSSVLDAISYALAGVCRGTDEGGRGADMLSTIKREGKLIPGSIVLKTSKGEIGRMVGQGPKSVAQQRAIQATGAEPAAVRVLVQSGQFMRLEPSEQKRLLLGAMGSQLTPEEVTKILGPDLARAVPDPAALCTVEALDEWEQSLREARPGLKRELGSAYVPSQGLPELAVEGDPGETLAKAKPLLAKLRQERDALVSRHAEAAGAGKARAQAFRATELELQRIDARLAEDGGSRDRLEAAVEDLRDKLGRADDLRQKRVAALEDATKSLSVYTARLQGLREQIQRISGLKDSCPTCLRELEPGRVKHIVERLKADGQNLLPEIKRLEKFVADLRQDGLDGSSGEREDLVALEKLLSEFDMLSRRRDEVLRQRQETEAKLAEVPAAEAPDTVELDARIAKGEELIEALQRHIQEAQRRQAYEAARAKKAQELEQVERCLELVGHKGLLRQRLMGGGMATFLEEINAVAGGLRLPRVSINVEPWRILVGDLPAALCSSSEEYRLALAFAGVMAKRSGFGLLCLDGAEILDGENRSIMPGVLEACGLEQAIVAATSDAPQGQDIPDWSFYIVEKPDGISQVASLTAVGA